MIKTKMKMDVGHNFIPLPDRIDLSFHIAIPMTPSEALTVPIYTAISIPTDSGSEAEDESEDGTGPKINLCILCPGKILKNEHMVKVHLDSNVSLVHHTLSL